LRFIDDQERAWLQQRIHEPVVGPNEGIAMILELESFKKKERDLAPTLDHAAQVSGSAKICSRVEGQRKQYLALDIALERNHVSLWNFHVGRIGWQSGQGNSIPLHNFLKIEPIDSTQGI